ncbi:MAG: prepilin-type N-terminal cleavage/methylation domain-containing protein [Candidatus Omnitrophota bacterium]
MKKGFTLLELLIGIAIFAIIAACVYSSLYLGLKVFKQEESRDELMQQAMLTLDKLAKDLRCAFINPNNEQIKFIGTDAKIDFFIVSPELDIENTVFYLEENEDSDVFSLLMSKTKVRYFEGDAEGKSKISVINRSIKEFKLAYYDHETKEWYENWPRELELPKLIKIKISFAQNSNQENFLDLVKYVAVPIAQTLEFTR